MNGETRETQEKLNRFVSAVNGKVDDQISRIIDEANAEKDSIIKSAEAKAAQQMEIEILNEQKHIAAKYQREISKTELEIKQEILLYREKLIDNIFNSVTQLVSDFSNSENYCDYLCKLISKTEIKELSVLHVKESDFKYKDALLKAADCGCSIEADKSIKYGGIAVITGAVMQDFTLDNALVEERKQFSSNYSFN